MEHHYIWIQEASATFMRKYRIQVCVPTAWASRLPLVIRTSEGNLESGFSCSIVFHPEIFDMRFNSDIILSQYLFEVRMSRHVAGCISRGGAAAL